MSPAGSLTEEPADRASRVLPDGNGFIRRRYPIQWLTLSSTPQSLEREGRIAHDGRCFELIVGDMTFTVPAGNSLGR